MEFSCPSCGMHLKAEAEHAGKYVKCPGCGTKMQVPAEESAPQQQPGAPQLNIPAPSIPTPSGVNRIPPPSNSQPQGDSGFKPSSVERHYGSRGGWEEADPTNVSMLVAFGIGLGITVVSLGILMLFAPPAGTPSSAYTFMQYLAMVWKGHLAVNALNTLFFFWAIAILAMKFLKAKRQREAMLLDVVPMKFGATINAENVGLFIDHIYKLPANLRDSMMVNRIRKSLELFEIKQSTGDVVHLMSVQSDIDAGRIQTSYTPVKAFLWAIPILGFIGTVLGLSHALLSLSFDNLEDVKAIIEVLKGVISGLGGAFDATLVGLVFAMLVNFPMNSMFKMEDDGANNIDTFCNEVLIPRLNDGSALAGGDTEAIMEHLVRAVANAQNDFLVDLNTLSATMLQYADNFQQQAAVYQQRVSEEFVTTMQEMRTEFQEAATDSVKTANDHTRALAEGIGALNKTLTDLGEKQVVINQTIKKGWFSRG